jgi:hypothetical protein
MHGGVEEKPKGERNTERKTPTNDSENGQPNQERGKNIAGGRR